MCPLADGTLPPSQVEGLKELGKWMAINKEALYAAKPPKFVEGAPDLWKSGTMRFLAKGDYIYASELGNEIMEVEDAEFYTKASNQGAIQYSRSRSFEGIRSYDAGKHEPLPWHMEGDELIVEKST